MDGHRDLCQKCSDFTSSLNIGKSFKKASQQLIELITSLNMENNILKLADR